MTGRPRQFRGISASPGIAVGRVYLLDRRRVRIRRYHIEPDQVDYEVERLRAGIQASIEQLESVKTDFTGGGVDHHAILEAHAMMVRDPALMDEAAALIRNELINAEWAVARVISRIRNIFDRVADPYFRERRGDIDFVGDRILRNLVGRSAELAELHGLDDGTVVVAHDLSPADTALLSRQRVTAFVTEVGGKTSHTSIVARSLDVPAVVGVHGIFDAAGSGDVIVVDGIEGSVLLRPTKAQLDRGRRRADRFRRVSLELLEAKALPARTIDHATVKVSGNIEIPNEISTVLSRGGEGIGLYRTEFMYIGRQQPAGEEEHYRAYCQVFDEVGNLSVTVRTLDLGGDKVFDSTPVEPEPNPALGLRAIRYCLQNRALFEQQIAGLLRAATRGDLRIMLPMISGVEELRAAKAIIDEVKQRLTREGKEFRDDVPLGIMIEVPSAALTADLLARECDFFSIGTNDLLQYLLAVDRTNDRVDYLYHPLHPSVLRTLQAVVEAGKRHGIPVSVCGEMAGDTDHTAILLGLGFEHLSMNAGSIPRVKRLIRELSVQDCKKLLEQAMQFSTWEEVENLVGRFLEAKTCGLYEGLDEQTNA